MDFLYFFLYFDRNWIYKIFFVSFLHNEKQLPAPLLKRHPRCFFYVIQNNFYAIQKNVAIT